MTYTICEPCIDVKDRACVDECPVDCIYEGTRMLYIQPDECVDCAACEPVCPVIAIFYEDDVPPSGSSSRPSTPSGSTTTSAGSARPGEQHRWDRRPSTIQSSRAGPPSN